MKRFRVYPVKGSLFIRVVVYPSARALRKAVGKHARLSPPPPEGKLKLTATTREWVVWRISADGRKRRNPCVAEIRLGADELGTRVITHEAFHATMAWARRNRFDWRRLGDEDGVLVEEALAYLHGDLSRLIVDRLYALGCYR